MRPLVRRPAARAAPSTRRADAVFDPGPFLLCLQMVAFLKSPAGQCLDRHPFVGLASLVFVAVSAVPVGFFLLLVVLTSLAAFVGVIVLEGILLSYSPRWKMTHSGGHSFVGICHSCQRSRLSKSHRPRQLVRVVKTWTPPVQFWTSYYVKWGCNNTSSRGYRQDRS